VRPRHPAVRRLVARAASLAVLASVAVGAMPAAASTALLARTGAHLDAGPSAVVDRLPDLRMATPTELRLRRFSSGTVALRFTAIIQNAGRGNFELRVSRPSSSHTVMTVKQRIFRSDGSSYYVTTPEVARYTGDGHDHWHVQKVATYELYRVGSSQLLRTGTKVGFCFFDTNNPVPDSIYSGPRYPRKYVESACGKRASLTLGRLGITPGWGDEYPWDFAYQYVKVTNLPAGDYVLKVIVDRPNSYRESSNTNNCSYARLRLDPAALKLTVLARGNTCP
jgi:hypothetical protein